MNVMEVNCDLTRALGIDPKDCSRVVMVVEPGQMPRLQVTRWVRTADGLQTAVQMLRLKPEAEAAPLDASGRPEPVVQYMGEVQSLQLKDDDAIVLSVDRLLSMEGADQLRAYVWSVFPGRKVWSWEAASSWACWSMFQRKPRPRAWTM